MAKQRTNKRGFVFENKIDLSNWVFNRLDFKAEDAFSAFEDNIVKTIEKEREKLEQKLGRTEEKIKKIASEALQITFEKSVTVGFWEVYSKPEMLSIYFDDFSQDGYEVSIDLKKAIRDCLLDFCDDDGYVRNDVEDVMIKFADMLKNLENEVRTAIRPAGEN